MEVPPIDLKVCVTVDLSSGQVFSTFGGGIFRGHQMRDIKGFGWTIFGLSDTDFAS